MCTWVGISWPMGNQVAIHPGANLVECQLDESYRRRISKTVKVDDSAHVLDGNCKRAFVGLYFVIKPRTLRNLIPRAQAPLPKYLKCSGPLPGLVMDLLIQPLSVIRRVWTPQKAYIV